MIIYMAVLLCFGLISPSLVISKTRKYPTKECKHYPPMAMFNETKFFQGTWHLAYTLYDDNDRAQINCETTKAEILPSGIIWTVSSSYFPEVKQFVNAETFLTSKEKDVGSYIAETRLFEKAGTKFVTDFITVPMTIIDTDYENYAITYICFYFETLFIGYTAVEVRNKTDLNALLATDDKIITLGLKLEDFLTTKNLTCVEDPNF